MTWGKGRSPYNGKPCRRGHEAERYVSSGSCIECFQLTSDPAFPRHAKKTYEETSAKMREWHHANYVPTPRRNANLDLPITREEALTTGAKRFFDGSTCNFGHTASKYTGVKQVGFCTECDRIYRSEKKTGVRTRVKVSRSVPKIDIDALAWVPHTNPQSPRLSCDNPAPHIFSAVYAKRMGLTRYFTGLPCGKGHIAERRVCRNICVMCNQEKAKKKKKPYVEWSEQKKTKFRATAKKWKNNNPEKIKTQQKEKNKREETRKQNDPEYAAKVILTNRTSYLNNVLNSVRDAMKTKIKKGCDPRQQPYWADVTLMGEIYQAARDLSKSTGEQHHVDHIVPMKGIVVDGVESWPVTGLHVAINLRPMTAIKNMRRKNKIDASEIAILYGSPEVSNTIH